MKAELYKRLFKAIYTEDIVSLKKIAITIIQEERKLGHNVLADSLEKLTITEKPKYTLFDSRRNETGLASLPKSKRNNSQLVSYIPREQLKHHMVLPEGVEERLLSIEQEYAARERLKRYNLVPKRKVLLYGPPGCGKTMSAERIAWNLGLPLLKVRFDSLLSSYFGESASNLRMVFDYCKNEPIFQIPIPEELSSVGEDYDILIEITLSYAANPRRTRRHIKGYLSTWLDWCCSRIGESAETFAQRIFETGSVIEDDGDFDWVLGEATNRGFADGYSRKKGTLQKDWCIIKSNQLSDAFCVAVRGHKGWGGLFKAKYSLAVSFEAINQDIPIYEPIRTEIETTIENKEIEVEMPDSK